MRTCGMTIPCMDLDVKAPSWLSKTVVSQGRQFIHDESTPVLLKFSSSICL